MYNSVCWLQCTRLFSASGLLSSLRFLWPTNLVDLELLAIVTWKHVSCVQQCISHSENFPKIHQAVYTCFAVLNISILMFKTALLFAAFHELENNRVLRMILFVGCMHTLIYYIVLYFNYIHERLCAMNFYPPPEFPIFSEQQNTPCYNPRIYSSGGIYRWKQRSCIDILVMVLTGYASAQLVRHYTLIAERLHKDDKKQLLTCTNTA